MHQAVGEKRKKWILLYSDIAWLTNRKVMTCQRKLMIGFDGAKVQCMKDHMKPRTWRKSDHAILHVLTNKLNRARESEFFPNSIVDLACTLKSNFVDVSVSNIIILNDKYNEKGIAVNNHLKRTYKEYFLPRSHKYHQITQSEYKQVIFEGRFYWGSIQYFSMTYNWKLRSIVF